MPMANQSSSPHLRPAISYLRATGTCSFFGARGRVKLLAERPLHLPTVYENAMRRCLKAMALAGCGVRLDHEKASVTADETESRQVGG